MSRGEFSERESADAGADEAEGGVAGGGGHAADLAVFALAEFEGEPGGGDVVSLADGRVARGEIGIGIEEFGAAGEGAVAADLDAGAENFEGRFVGDAFDLDGVAAAVAEFRVKELVDDLVLVGEEEEAFGVEVEATDGEDGVGEIEFGEGALGGFVGVLVELAEDAEGFVEGEEHLPTLNVQLFDVPTR